MPQNGNAIAQRVARVARWLHTVIKSSVVWRNMVIAYHMVHNLCYITGVQTMRFAHFVRRRLVRLLVPIGRFFYRAVDRLLFRHIRSLAHGIASEARRFVQGFPMAAHRVKDAFGRGLFSGVGATLVLPFLAVRRHRRALFTLGNLAAPVAAVYVLMFTIQFWSGMTFALAVDYDGQRLGYITDEAVYDSAANMATERVNNIDNSFEVQRVPKMTITVVSKTDILDEAEVCDKILQSSSDSIAEVSGLYIDGKFEGAVQSRGELDALLESLLSKYRNGSPNERAEFVQDVKVVDGLYPVSSVVTANTMSDHLTEQTMVDKYYEIVKGDSPLLIAAKTDMSLAELRSLNLDFDKHIFPEVKVLIQKSQSYLRVQVVRTVEYTETVDYKTQTVQDAKQYIGYSTVRTKGVEGEQKVKAEVTLLDGIEQSRKILSTTVTKKAVDKVVVVGAKKVNPNVSAAGDGISTGRFMWPLPSCRSISSGYGYRWGRFHSGIDISGNGVYGKPVISADGGTVVEVNTGGWGAGYGKYIIVDHGGGYRTLYAHLSSVMVRTGMKVSQGQQIGRAGSSGDSTGPHLHFEIRINGRSVSPTAYLK